MQKSYPTIIKDVTVVIVDTDVTYQLRGTKFTSIPAMPGIKKNLGIFAYMLGELEKLRDQLRWQYLMMRMLIKSLK